MRITVLDNDPGQKIDPSRERYRVFIDGEVVRYCLTADDEKGEITEAVTDENSRIVAENGEVKRQTRHGEVRIERCPR